MATAAVGSSLRGFRRIAAARAVDIDVAPLTDQPETVAPQVPARFPLAWICLGAMLAGALANLVIATNPFANADTASFLQIARSVLAGHGLVYHEAQFPTVPLYAFRSPGYSVFLAFGLWLGGIGGILALQGALHGLGSALVADLAGRWAGLRTAWIAFALHFLWPAGWTYAGLLTTEMLFEFTVILTVWLVVRAADRQRIGWAVAAGVVAAISVLTRPTGLGCALGVGVWLALRSPRLAVATIAALVIAYAPWPVRNAIRLHAFVPLLTSGGVASWNIQSNHEPHVAWEWMARHQDLGEIGYDRHFNEATRAILLADPLAYARRVGRAAIEYAGPILDRRPGSWMHRFALLAALPALLLADWRRRLVLPVLVWVGQGVLLIPIAVHVRYRFPTEWVPVVIAATGLAALSYRWGARRTALAAGVALTLCVGFTIAVMRP